MMPIIDVGKFDSDESDSEEAKDFVNSDVKTPISKNSMSSNSNSECWQTN